MKAKEHVDSDAQSKASEAKETRATPGYLGVRASGAHRPKVLVIEDSPIIRERLVDLIKRSDTVELAGCAENGVQGIEMLIALRPDVVLLDLQLPGLSGFDLLPTIKRERPECLVIVLTCLADDATRARCMELGADYFFDKATDFEQISHVIKPKR